jgi:hypothetical protein
MANNQLKYTRIDTAARAKKRAEWNQPIFWPILVAAGLFAGLLVPAVRAYRRRTHYRNHDQNHYQNKEPMQ